MTLPHRAPSGYESERAARIAKDERRQAVVYRAAANRLVGSSDDDDVRLPQRTFTAWDAQAWAERETRSAAAAYTESPTKGTGARWGPEPSKNDTAQRAEAEPPAPQWPPPEERLPILTCGQLVTEYPERRPPVIDGLLRQGETMNIIATSKAGKSWLVHGLAFAVALGQKWLGVFPTTQGRVLIIDNELHRDTLAHRLRILAGALRIPLEDLADRVDVICLRGQLKNLYDLGHLFERIEPGRYKLVIIDAWYRTLPIGTDENNNAAVADLYNLLDQHAEKLQSSFALIHHSSKGDQSQKAITDVGAGAGSASRAADTHLILRPHEEDKVVVLDAAVRSWEPVQARCLRWDFPLWILVLELDPGKLRTPNRRQRAAREEETPRKPAEPPWTAKRFAETFGKGDPQVRGALLEAAQTASLADRKIKDLFKNAVDLGYLYSWRDPATGKNLVSAQPQKRERGRPRKNANNSGDFSNGVSPHKNQGET